MSKIDRDYENKEYNSSDSKWLEDWMKAESEEIDIPESLEPENVAKMLQGVKQKNHHDSRQWRKTAIGVAACLAVVGLSMTALQMGDSKKDCSFDSANLVESAKEESNSFVEETESLVQDNNSNLGSKEESPIYDETTTKKQEGVLETADVGAMLSGEGTGFSKGNGNSILEEDGCLYTGEEKELVVSTLEKGSVKEVTRVSMNQEVREFQYVDKKLACLTSDTLSTTITVYQMENPSEPKEGLSISVDGDYQCSYLDGEMLYVFTQAQKVQRVDLASGGTNTFSLDDGMDAYYVEDGFIYGVCAVEDGTWIREYEISESALKKGGDVTGDFWLNSVMDIRKVGSKLEFLVKKGTTVTLITYDEELRKTGEKTNELGAVDCAGVFTNKGILVVSVKEQEAFISMLDEENMQTKGSKLLQGIQKIELGRFWLSDENGWIGLAKYHDENEAGSYEVYQYDSEQGITEVNYGSVEPAIQLNEVVCGSAVVNEGVGKLEVLVK